MSNSIAKVFSSRLCQLMQEGVGEKRVTQQDLAAATGYTRQAISQYMDGSVLPNIEKLQTFAKYFNVSADYFLGLTHVQTPDKDVQFICDYTGLSEKAVEILADQKEYYGFDGKVGNPQSMIDTICAMIEEYDAAPYKALLYMIKSYPVNGFHFDDKEAKRLKESLDDFMNLDPFFSAGINLQEVIQTAYLTKLYAEIMDFKQFQRNRFMDKSNANKDSAPHINFLDYMKELNASKSTGDNNGDD